MSVGNARTPEMPGFLVSGHNTPRPTATRLNLSASRGLSSDPGPGISAFARLPTRQQVLHADVLIQVGPVNPLPAADQFPVASLLRRGMHQAGIPASGTEMVRPSDSSAVRVSSVTATVMASGTLISVVETCIPLSQERSLILRGD